MPSDNDVNKGSKTTLPTESAPYKNRTRPCDGKKTVENEPPKNTARKRKLMRGTEIVHTAKRKRLSNEIKENDNGCEYCSCKNSKGPNSNISHVTYSTDYKTKLRDRGLTPKQNAKRKLDETNENPEKQETSFCDCEEINETKQDFSMLHTKKLRNRVIVLNSNYKKDKKKRIQKGSPFKVLKKNKHDEMRAKKARGKREWDREGECEGENVGERAGKLKNKRKIKRKRREEKREKRNQGEGYKNKGKSENPNDLKVRESSEANNDCQTNKDELSVTTVKIKVLLDPKTQCYTGEVKFKRIQKITMRKALNLTNCNKIPKNQEDHNSIIE